MLRAKLGRERVTRAHFEVLIVETGDAVGEDGRPISSHRHLDIEHEARGGHVLKCKYVGRCGWHELPGMLQTAAIHRQIQQESGGSHDRCGCALSQTLSAGARTQPVAAKSVRRAMPGNPCRRAATTRAATTGAASFGASTGVSDSPDVGGVDDVERRGFTRGQKREGAEQACNMRGHFPCCAIENLETNDGRV